MISLSFIYLFFYDVDSNYKFVTATGNTCVNYNQNNCFNSPCKKYLLFWRNWQNVVPVRTNI